MGVYVVKIVINENTNFSKYSRKSILLFPHCNFGSTLDLGQGQLFQNNRFTSVSSLNGSKKAQPNSKRSASFHTKTMLIGIASWMI
jgi:hypothetical protein